MLGNELEKWEGVKDDDQLILVKLRKIISLKMEC